MTSGVDVPPSDGFPNTVPLPIIGNELWLVPNREAGAGNVGAGKSGGGTEGTPNRVGVAIRSKGLKEAESGRTEGTVHCWEKPEEVAAAWAEDCPNGASWNGDKPDRLACPKPEEPGAERGGVVDFVGGAALIPKKEV